MSEIEDIVDEGTEHKTWKGKLWSVIKVVLIIVVTGGLLYWVFSKVPFEKITSRLSNANKFWMVMAVGSYFISMLLSAWRLLSFFKSINLRLDWRFNLRLYFVGLCYNVLLPGGIGGDGYKVYLLHKRYKQPTKKMLLAILFDRLSGLWAIGLIVVALIVLIPQIELHLGIPLSIFTVGSIVYYFVAHKFFKEYTHNFISAHAKAVGVQTMQVLTIVCLLLAQDFSGKFAPYLLSFLISSLAAIIPFSLGGGGVRDFIFMNLSKPFNLTQDMAVYLSFTFYLISIAIALLGVYYVFRTSRLEEGLPGIEEKDEPA
ncbi:MAG: flippase-like domain-containing protein [Sphingobacteriaceae bacterium]|nr:MAG: flippase-like domain-containing protein [Sphingobacteriaceae bacterium]